MFEYTTAPKHSSQKRGRCTSVFLFVAGAALFFQPIQAAAQTFTYENGDNNPDAIELVDATSFFEIDSGAAEQSGPITAAEEALVMEKRGAGSLTFSAPISLSDAEIVVSEGEFVATAVGSSAALLVVDNEDALNPPPSFRLEGGSLTLETLVVGGFGPGLLEVSGGGQLGGAFAQVSVGFVEGSSGEIRIVGPGSQLTAECMDLGFEGVGILTVANGGLLSMSDECSGTIVLGFDTTGNGTLNVGASAADAPVGAGIISAAAVIGGAGDAVVNFNHTNADYFFTSNGEETGVGVPLDGELALIHRGTGQTTLTASGTFEGSTTITSGTLVISDVGTGASVLGTSSVLVQEGGVLAGTGNILGDAIVEGSLSPGNSAGLLAFAGDLSFAGTAILIMEIGGITPDTFDRISVTEQLAYNGLLQISFLNGFLPDLNDTFVLFQDFASQTGSFSSVVFDSAGYAGNLDYATGTLTITAIPEPRAGMLVLFAAAAMFLRLRRR